MLLILLLLLSCASVYSNVDDWDVLIYMAADNDLFQYADYSISSMSADVMKKNPRVNVTIFCDGRYKKYGSEKSEAHIFKLAENGVRVVEELGELNSGSEETLKAFIDGHISHKARKNALILWGHGGGLDEEMSQPGFLKDDHANAPVKAMKLEELFQVIEHTYKKLGRKIDLIGLDACVLMNAEVAHAIRNWGLYFAGAQGKQNALSWDYKSLVRWFNNNSLEPIEKFINYTVASFGAFYDYAIHEIYVSNMKDRSHDAFSIIDLSKIDGLSLKLKAFVEEFRDSDVYTEINSDIKRAIVQEVIKPSRTEGGIHSIDLKSFMERLKVLLNKRNIYTFDEKIDDLMLALNGTIKSHYSRNVMKSSKGLSIRDLHPYAFEEESYKNYSFDVNKFWVRFLIELSENRLDYFRN